MNKRIGALLIIIVIILAALGAWWVLAQPGTVDETPTSTHKHDSTSETTPTATDETAPIGLTIVFTNEGFEKDKYTVKAGETVKVKNESSVDVQFSSDNHPTHTDNPELNMAALAPGHEGTFTPHHVGTWGIHDHEHPEFTTTLVVTQ